MRIACFAVAALTCSAAFAEMPADEQGQAQTHTQEGQPERNEMQPMVRKVLPLHRHPTLLSMLRRNNDIRRRLGLMPHRIHPALTQAAQDHANYMARTGDFQHYSNGGPQSRAVRYGFRGFVRENIAYNYRSVEDAFSVWQGSSGHYASIVSGTSEAGFGYAVGNNGAVYYVGVYGTAAQGDGIGEDEAVAAKLAAEALSAETTDDETKVDGQVVPAAAEEAVPATAEGAAPAVETAPVEESAVVEGQPQTRQAVPTYHNNNNRGRGLFRRRR